MSAAEVMNPIEASPWSGRAIVLLLLLVTLATTVCAGVEVASPSAPRETVFDPERDSNREFSEALEAARRTDRKVLVIVGGDWCDWCIALGRVLRREDVKAEFDAAFVVQRVAVGRQNRNRSLLKQFPRFRSVPHFFIVGSSGELLGSQAPDVFEEEAGYSTQKLIQFAHHWAASRGQRER